MDAALATLLDDPSPPVRQALLAYFSAHQNEAEAFLRAAAASQPGPVAEAAARYLKELNLADPVGDFREFIRSLNYELESGLLLLARIVTPALDAGSCHAALDAIADRCRELIVEPASPREQCRLINRVLFHEWGLHLDADEGGDPRSQLIDHILERRKGGAVALGALYLLVAARLGLDLEAVAPLGGFFLAGVADGGPFYVDPAEQGSFRSEEEVVELLIAREEPPLEGDLGPAPIREVLCRLCRVLAAQYRQSGEAERGRLFASFIDEFDAAYAENMPDDSELQ